MNLIAEIDWNTSTGFGQIVGFTVVVVLVWACWKGLPDGMQ